MLPTKNIKYLKLKPHEIFAICLHFLNNKYYLKHIDRYSNELVFVDINYLSDELNSITSSEAQFDYKDLEYTIKYQNVYHHSSHSNRPSVSVRLKSIISDELVSVYNYDDKYCDNINRCVFNNQTYNLITPEDMEKLKEKQTNVIKKIKFFEENQKYVAPYLHAGSGSGSYNRHTRKAYNQNYVTFMKLYHFKPYIESIKSYLKNSTQSYKFDRLKEFYDCIVKDMQVDKTYSNKILSFTKDRHDQIKIVFNKTNCEHMDYINDFKNNIDQYYFNKFFDLVIPIMEHLGGIQELKTIILKNRLLTE